jgi:ABC-2 type transport system ATP-binding protein
MLRFEDVTKRFGDITAVDGLTLEIEPGEIFGFLGPNGAGKTTSVNMAVGILKPDAGRVWLEPHGTPDQPDVRQRIGVATQALAIYENLTGAENLRFFGRLYGLTRKKLDQRVAWGLDFVGLTDRQNDRVAEYSGGMKRRVNLAAALIHDPEILICDEPTVGVDPQSRNAILERILKLKELGRTVVYTTHYMEEAERVCDRIGIIDHGKLLALDTVEGLIKRLGGPLKVSVEQDDGETLELEADDAMSVFRKLSELGGIRSFRTVEPDLEAVFLNLTGRRLRD